MKIQYLNKLTILSSLFFIFNLGSQEMTAMDQDFLDSLPESVQEDLMSEMKDEKNDIKNLQSRPSSTLSKYETIDNWEKFKRQQSI